MSEDTKEKEVKKVGKDKFTKSELGAMAKETFKRLKNTKELYASEDGQIFFTENDAKLHAKRRGLEVSKHTK